jgi:fatty-acyl-CoA synthase
LDRPIALHNAMGLVPFMQSLLNAERQRGGVDFLLHRAAEICPDRVAIDDRMNGLILTYAELRARSIRLARGLRSLGINKGDVVATAFRNEVYAIEVLFACAMIGAVSAPLNNRLSPIEAREFIKAQGASAFVGNSAYRPFAEGTNVGHVVIQGGIDTGQAFGDEREYEGLLLGQSAMPFPPQATWVDPYMIGMTGGTTGGSKGAIWSHGGIMFDVLSIINHWGIRRGFRSLCYAPLYHGAGLTWACLPVLWQVGTIILPASPSFDAVAFLESVVRDQLDCFFLVPAMVPPLYLSWNGVPMTGVKSIALSAAPVPKTTRLKVKEMFPAADSLVCYGMTECFSMTMQDPRDFVTYGDTVGHHALTARVRIVNDDGCEVSIGTAGNVVARTLAESLGYNNNPASTATTFAPCKDDPEQLDWVYTGDVGYFNADGRLTLLDRAKDIIISGGENVPSIEVEATLTLDPDVIECAAVGVANDKWGEMVFAIIVAAPGVDRKSLAKRLLALCRERLATFKVPKSYVFIESLPRSSSGKVLKRELRQRAYSERFDLDDLRA